MKNFLFCLIFYIISLFLCLERMNAQSPGIPDMQFGIGGKVELYDSTGSYANPISLLAPKGKILIVSTLQVVKKSAKIVLTRLLPNGDRDSTFGVNGQLSPAINFDLGTWGIVNGAVLDAENRLLLCGGTAPPDNTISHYSGAAFVMRLGMNGHLDFTFGNGGVQLLDIENYVSRFTSLICRPDSKIIASGFTAKIGETKLNLVQLLPDGTLDLNFADHGIYLANPNYSTYVKSMALQSDGKLLTFGSVFSDTDERMQVMRFNLDGTIDHSFALHGSFTWSFTNGDYSGRNSAYSGAIQPDQKIVFCSGSYYQRIGQPNRTSNLIRLEPDGDLDDNFGTSGMIQIDNIAYDARCSITLQLDDKILINSIPILTPSMPESYSRACFTRFNVDGSPDQTFGNKGAILSTKDTIYNINNFLVDSEGKIIFYYTNYEKVVLWRYHNFGDEFVEESKVDSIFQVRFTPNPASNQGVINWTMPFPDDLSSDLYDAQGRLLRHLIPPTYFQAGTHQQDVYFESNIPSGLYYLTLTTGSDRRVLKLIIAE